MIPIARPVMGEEEKRAVREVLDSGMLVQGKKVEELERRFAAYCGTKYAIAVNSGTAALHTALYALGIGAKDTVITTPFTFVATANSILMQNAKVAFADIRLDTFNIDPGKIKVKSSTKAIITVDLFGQLADYGSIEPIARKSKLRVIEDAAQSMGAGYGKRKAGSFGDIACFSLYATKNLTSGEGGIITTDSLKYCELAKMFRSHGQKGSSKYDYNGVGYNYRMTDILAAIALEQLKKIDSFNEIRRKNARFLTESIGDISGITTPYEEPNHSHVFHQYTILVDKKKRDSVVSYLQKNGIGCAVFYPKPLHLYGHFMKLGYNKGDFPVAEEISKRVISLPVHPLLTETDLMKIVAALKEAMK